MFKSFIFFTGFILVEIFGDSPITSTPFYKAYLDKSYIKKAEKSGTLNNYLCLILDDPKLSLDRKAALINALSWKIEGKNNAEIFLNYLAKKYKKEKSDLKLEELRADEIFSLGYLTALDDYFHPEKSIPILSLALKKLKKSFTTNIIFAIVKAQKLMKTDECSAWKTVNSVLKNKNLRKDMRPEAVKIIVDYMKLYKELCKKNK